MSLKDKGYIFGLGAFRRYHDITGGDLEHFDEALVASDKLGVVEANHRWAVMLKCAHDVYVAKNGGESLSVDEFEILLDEAPQTESDQLMQQYLDSNFMGQKLRVYYGIPEPDEGAKKKRTARAKQSPSRTK